MKQKIYIHIGYPKTGTTTLQKHFYPHIADVNYLGIYSNRRDDSLFGLDFIQNIFFESEKNIDFDEMSMFAKNAVDQSKVAVFSHEELLSLCLKKTFLNNFNSIGKDIVLPKPKDVALKLRKSFPEDDFDVHIICTIRKQDEMLTSLYAQSYVHYYSLDKEVDTFKKFFSIFTSQHQAHPFKNALDYDAVISGYEEFFGSENVNVLVFEELAQNPKVFYTKLCNVLGVSTEKYAKIALKKVENKRSTTESYKKAKKLSLFDILIRFKVKYLSSVRFSFIPKSFVHFLKNTTVSSNNKVSKTIFLEDFEVEMVLNEYSESNRRISERYGLYLNEFGYYK